MLSAKKGQRDPEVEICAGQDVAQKIIDERIAELKAAHPSLPEPTLRMDVMKHSGCVCAVARHIIAERSKQ